MTFQTTKGSLKTATKILTGITATTVIAATSATGPMTIELINLAEVAAGTPTLILDLYDGAAVLAKIRGTKAMVASTPERIEGPFVLEPGWSLRATASVADQVHVTATYFNPDA